MTPIPDRLSAALSDRYRIERELGQGGMATVYLAQDLKHDRQVAIKVLKPELAAVLGAERFVVEIKTTAALQHPHILPLFDSGSAGQQDGGTAYLFYVMPFIDGETLRSKLDRETQLGIEEAVKITIAVADALDYAHRHGVIHRDIKPENILLHEGRPMVADFGIALAVSAAAGGRLTETGLSLGTPHYMSPEQATAEREITGRSDIYSLGCMLYEMLTGEPPHMGNSAQQIIMKIITEEAAPVAKLRKAVPPNVAAALATALEKLPADRFATVRAFAEALGSPAYTRSGGGAAGQGHAAAGGWRARLAVPALALAALLLVVVAWGETRLEAPKPVSRYVVAWPTSGSGLFGNLAVSPDGSHLALVGSDGGAPRVLIRRRDQLDFVALAGTEGAGNPAFSPSGDRIVFMADGILKIVDLVGGPVSTLTDSLVGVPGLTWGPDGYIYYDQRGIGPLLRVREAGGPPEVVSTLDTTAGELQHVWPDVLPNGRGVIMSVNRGGPGLGAFETDGIAVLDLRTGRHQELFRGIYARYTSSGHLLYVTVEGQLFAVPFDQDRLELTGPAVPLVEGVTIRPGGSGAVDLTISRDGTLWYTTGGERAANRELVWATRDGQIAPVEPEISGLITDAALAPDGSRLAFILRGPEGGTLWVNRLGSSGRDRLTFEQSYDRVTWSPDSRSLIVSKVRGQAMQVAADGSALAAPIPGLPRDVQDLHWSPDGAWLLYSIQSGTADIFGFRPGVDSAPQPLVTTPRADSWPMVSPNGRWLLSQSGVGARNTLHVRPFPNTAGALRQVSAAFGRYARWSSTGQEIFFRTNEDSLVVVPVLPGEGFALGQERVLFSLRDVAGWDVAPGGQRFLLTRSRRASAAPRLIVVENFFEELRRSVPR